MYRNCIYDVPQSIIVSIYKIFTFYEAYRSTFEIDVLVYQLLHSRGKVLNNAFIKSNQKYNCQY